MTYRIFHMRYVIWMLHPWRRRVVGRRRRSRSWRLPLYYQLIIDLLDAFDLFDNGFHCDSIFILRRFAFQSPHARLDAGRDVAVTGGGESRLDLTQQERLFRLFLHPLSDIADGFLRLLLYLHSGWNPGSGHGRIDNDLVADAPDAFDFTGDLFRRVLLLLRGRLASQRDIAVQSIHIDAAGADAPVGCHSSFDPGR